METNFEKFGVQELTRLEQRELAGGEGFWRMAGRFVGIFASFFVDLIETQWEGGYLRDAPNLDGLVGFSGGG